MIRSSFSPSQTLPDPAIIPDNASDFGKLISLSENNGARVHDAGRTRYAREPVGADLAGLKKFKVGLAHKSAVEIDGRQVSVRFKSFGFKNGETGTINDKPVAIYQKGSLWNPFAPLYYIDMEREEKGLEHCKGYPLSDLGEIEMPFNFRDAESYRAVCRPYLEVRNMFPEREDFSFWKKVGSSKIPKKIVQRNPAIMIEKIVEPISGLPLTGAEGYYHAVSIRGVDLDQVKGLVAPHNRKAHPRNFAMVPGRIDTDKIIKLHTRITWTMDADPNPVSAYRNRNYKLEPRVEL